MMKRLSSFRNQGRKEVIAVSFAERKTIIVQIAAPIVQSQQERSLALRSWNVATTLGGSKKADANSVVEKTKNKGEQTMKLKKKHKQIAKKKHFITDKASEYMHLPENYENLLAISQEMMFYSHDGDTGVWVAKNNNSYAMNKDSLYGPFPDLNEALTFAARIFGVKRFSTPFVS
jgi:hypothetical protein